MLPSADALEGFELAVVAKGDIDVKASVFVDSHIFSRNSIYAFKFPLPGNADRIRFFFTAGKRHENRYD